MKPQLKTSISLLGCMVSAMFCFSGGALGQIKVQTLDAKSDVIQKNDKEYKVIKNPEDIEKLKAQYRAYGGKEGVAKPDQQAAGQPAVQPGNQPGEQPMSKPGETPSQPGDKPSDAAATTVQRPVEPPAKPDPKELAVLMNEDGLLEFQFRNQPWPDVLRWLASVSSLSLDWQELPADYINLATQRPFTLSETTDIINRALLMRGFTLLEHEGVLTVAKTAEINPALVPRVAPEQLTDLPPHKFVRTSFTLTWLLADQVHGEFMSMVSKNGKLTALASTNRLEGMDAVANLRDIYDILQNEQSAVALENLAREFPLQYAKASSVKSQLEAFLGIEGGGGGQGAVGNSRDAARMMAQQMQMMQQQMQQAQRGGAVPAPRGKIDDKVYLVANDRSNSIIVHAPPNKMGIIESFIARVDVPNENAADFQRMSARMKVFRLSSLSPGDLVASLTSMDVLEPTSRLQVDDENNAIIVYASVADQYMIQSVIDRLDGSERSFEVVELRRLDAESVAGSIRFLMGVDEEEEGTSRKQWWEVYNTSSSSKGSDKMRVGANVQDNQLLLWVNQMEMEEIEGLLKKLGEIPTAGQNSSTMRVIDASRQPETYEYLQRLKEQWEQVSPNKIAIPDASEFQSDELDSSKLDSGDSNSENWDGGNRGKKPSVDLKQPSKAPLRPAEDAPKALPIEETTSVSERALSPSGELSGELSGDSPLFDRLVSTSQIGSNSSLLQESSPAAVAASQAGQSAPISISIDAAGNLVIASEDTEALDRLERLMNDVRPPRRPYDIFKVKYATASWITLNLEEYFEKEEDNEANPFRFFFDGGGNNRQNEGRQLGDRPPLRFIYDNDTQSIVVQGADDIQRQTIKELIELWDVPEPQDDEGIRYTKLMKIQFSSAEAIVATMKEAYRDLLSANDAAFQQPKQGAEEKRSSSSGGVESGGGMSFAFKGKLSLGADPITNSIIVSAEGQLLLELVCDMIEQLDVAAQPQGNFEIVTVPPALNGRSLEDALRALTGSPRSRQQANQQQKNSQQANPQQQQPPQQPNKEVFQGNVGGIQGAVRGKAMNLGGGAVQGIFVK